MNRSTTAKGWNMKMAVLQSIGIILVVIGHMGKSAIFTDWFPIFSFHMPLFFFISGYFYNAECEKNIKAYFLKKIKTLFIPFFVLNFIYGIISIIFRYQKIINYGHAINIKSLLIIPWQSGYQFGINVSSWYVLALLLVQITYIIIRKTTKIKNESILLIVLFIFSYIAVYFAYLDNSYRLDWFLTIQHVLYALPFYQMGYIYKEVYEKKNSINIYIYFLIIFIFQSILFYYSKNNVYINMRGAIYNHFHSVPLIGLLTPIAGIFFWLKISQIISNMLKENNIIKFISQNTWSIMMHHQFVFLSINTLFFLFNKHFGIFSDFNVKSFQSNVWYEYKVFGDYKFNLVYILLGILIPLIIKFYLIKYSEKNKTIKYAAGIF